MQTKEQESGKVEAESVPAEYLTFSVRARMKLGASFHFQFDPQSNRKASP
jgi:hypothetical protein